MDSLQKAIDTCNNLLDEVTSTSHYDTFGSKMRATGSFFEDDFEDVIKAMEEAQSHIEDLENKNQELEDQIKELQDKIQELEEAHAE